MQIRARLSISADGYVTTPSGWPAQLADPTFVPGESHGIAEFLEPCEAALMGRTTFEPALGRDRAANKGGDVHLVGGPTTIETYRALGALDRLELVVLPLLLGDGMRLTPALSLDTGLTLERERALPGGSVEIVYDVRRAA